VVVDAIEAVPVLTRGGKREDGGNLQSSVILRNDFYDETHPQHRGGGQRKYRFNGKPPRMNFVPQSESKAARAKE